MSRIEKRLSDLHGMLLMGGSERDMARDEIEGYIRICSFLHRLGSNSLDKNDGNYQKGGTAHTLITCMCGDASHSIPIYKRDYTHQFNSHHIPSFVLSVGVIHIPMVLIMCSPMQPLRMGSLPDLGIFIQAALQSSMFNNT